MLHSHPRRILVVTVVHDPRDSRIWFRQIGALLDRGWHVTYAAPFSSDFPFVTAHLAPDALDRLRLVTVPRARGRSRIRAMMSARRLLRSESKSHDVVLIHDPELLAASYGLHIPHLVWDVHEDTVGSLGQKEWLPGVIHGPTARMIRSMERWAEEHFTLLLAETGYQKRFRRPHAVVPNAVIVPENVSPAGHDRVVYLGSLTRARGSNQLPEIGRLLKLRSGGTISLEVIGPTYDHATKELMLKGHANQDLIWYGFLPADQALGRVRGALAGLSLLSDTPNFRNSMPTKVLEYCAYGVPVITTPLPSAAELVMRSGSGVVVPWNSPEAIVNVVMTLSRQEGAAQEMGRRGYHVASTEYDWAHWSEILANELESVVGRTSTVIADGRAVRL